MIFVTVGTHEQPFNRLVKYIDGLKRDNIITEDVIMQIGYSTYEPKYCTWKKLFPYQKMLELVNTARIVITHGGPSSFIMAIQSGKTPIVVPRQARFGEHVNDHQVTFCKEVERRMGTIVVVEDIENLKNVIEGYEQIKSRYKSSSNNAKFCERFEIIVEDLFASK